MATFLPYPSPPDLPESVHSAAGQLSLPVVLIADDHSVNHLLAAAELDDICMLVSAKDGERALELAADMQPDLILLDVNMPGGIDGFEVCCRLKANPGTANVAVIFLTAVDAFDAEEKGLELGAVDYIHKPFHPPILRARVRNHLLLQHQRQQLERLSHIDPLTRLMNRRGFEDTLRREWLRSARMRKPLSLLLVAIDEFSEYSYAAGYVASEVLLQELGDVLSREMLRGNDYAAYCGGAKFACLLGETDSKGATVLAQRIQAHVARLAIPYAHSAKSVSVSVGAASDVPQPSTDASELVARASGYLADALAQGFNQCVSK